MRTSITFVTAAAFAALAAAAAARPAPPSRALAEVMAAERAFAAEAIEHGLHQSFAVWAAPDGIVFRPDPSNARRANAKPSKIGPPYLKWWPAHGAVARSGDLAFDTGPWTYGLKDEAHGWFFTIWKRQADGSWKWLMDHGYDGPSDHGRTREAPTTALPVAKAGVGSAPAAFEQIRAEEAALSAELAAGRAGAAYGARLSDDAWIGGLEPDGPAATASAVQAALAARPQTLTEALGGGGASKAGDLAYAWGRASWNAGGKAVPGHYVRVWQRRGQAWKIVFDVTAAD